MSPRAIEARRQDGHQPYLATVAGEPAAFGWSASRSADIGELGIKLELSPNERYFWDFVTVPAWRGRGVYPRLLQVLIARELEQGVDRFWIGHEADNVASAHGILRAGFKPAGELLILGRGRLALAPTGPVERARRGAELLGVPLRGPD